MNQDQTKYINGLDYEYTGSQEDLSNIELSPEVVNSLAGVKTAADLVNTIKAVNCFGLKDTLIVGLLG